MRCRKVVDLLPLLAGGDLAPERAAEVREHLARCFACTRAFAGQVSAQEALASVAWHHRSETDETIGGVGPEFFDRMREEILAEVATEPVPAPGAHPWLRRRRFWFGGGFAAASILFVLGFVLGRGLLGHDGPLAPNPRGSARPHGPALPYQSAEPVSIKGPGAGSGHDSQPLGAHVSTRDYGEFPLCGEDPEPLPEDGGRRATSRPGSVPAAPPRGEDPRGDRR